MSTFAARRGAPGASSLSAAVDRVLRHIGFDAAGTVGSPAASATAACGFLGSSLHDAQPVTNSFEVAQSSLRAILGKRIQSLNVQGAGRGSDEDPFLHVKALREVFAARSEMAMRITVPRDFVNAVDGFMPFFLQQAQFHRAQMESARVAFEHRTRQYSSATSSSSLSASAPGTLDDEGVVAERLLDWMELFYPEKDYNVLPFPMLMAAVDGFFVYQKGGVHLGVPLDNMRPYHGVDMPIADEEMVLYRALYHWLLDYGVASRTFQTALDCGTKSGLVSALMIKANMNTVVAVDDNDFALQNLQDNLKRLKRRGTIRKKAVYTMRNNDLLPKSPSAAAAAAAGNGARGVGKDATAAGNPFLDAAVRRRMAGRSPIMNVAGAIEEELETHVEAAANADLTLNRPYDLLTFHRPVPNLFAHPMQSRLSAMIGGSTSLQGDPHLGKVLDLLESSADHEGLLSASNGHVAIIASNYHQLLNGASGGGGGGSLSPSDEEALQIPQHLRHTLAYSILQRTNKAFSKTSLQGVAAGTKRIIGWDIVRRETRPLASLGDQYFGGSGPTGRGGMFKSLIADGAQGYAAYAETKDFYDKLRHEFIVLTPRYSKLYGGLDLDSAAMGGSGGSAAASPSQRRDSVNPFASNDLIDWEDTFEYNNYLPKDGSGNAFHVTAAGPSYSYLEDDVYGEAPSALQQGGGGAFYNSADPADALGRMGNSNMRAVAQQRAMDEQSAAKRAMRYTKGGAPPSTVAAAADPFVSRGQFGGAAAYDEFSDGSSPTRRKDINKATGTTPMFDLVFNRAAREKRQRQFRKLGFDSQERQKYYLDKKVVESQAAKLQMLNEIDRFNFNDPSMKF